MRRARWAILSSALALFASSPACADDGQAVLVGTTTGAAAVAATFGVTFALQAQDAQNIAAGIRFQLNSPSACYMVSSPICSALKSSVDTQNLSATLSDGFYGAGVAFASVALVAWLLWPKPKSTAWVAPLTLVF